MSDQFNYKLVTPEKIYLEGDAQMVVLPGAEGDLGVLPNHSNIITSLRPGIIKVTNSDQTQSLFVEEGFIKFSNNELLVIAVGLDEEAALNNDFINDKIENYSSALDVADEAQKMKIQIDDFVDLNKCCKTNIDLQNSVLEHILTSCQRLRTFWQHLATRGVS